MIKKLLVFLFLILSVFSFSEILSIYSDEGIMRDDVYILNGNSRIAKGNLNIETDIATITVINDEPDKMKSDFTKIKSDTYEATSNSLSFDLKKETGELLGNVDLIVRMDNSDIIISSDVIKIDNKLKSYEGSSESYVLILKGDYVIKSKTFQYRESEKKLILEGEVWIVNEKKKMDLKSEKSVFNTETNEVEGKKINLTLEIEDN
ncbi:MAG TPA: LptA/OstA family protein [Tepiditoga sp.]|nr:LptA/OstA family protein [Tepiditoga sp.]